MTKVGRGTDSWWRLQKWVVCTNRVVKMKEYLPFCKEFSILCIEDRVVVDSVV